MKLLIISLILCWGLYASARDDTQFFDEVKNESDLDLRAGHTPPTSEDDDLSKSQVGKNLQDLDRELLTDGNTASDRIFGGLKKKWKKLKRRLEKKWRDQKRKLEDKWRKRKSSWEMKWRNIKKRLQNKWQGTKRRLEKKWKNTKRRMENKWKKAKQELEDKVKRWKKSYEDLRRPYDALRRKIAWLSKQLLWR